MWPNLSVAQKKDTLFTNQELTKFAHIFQKLNAEEKKAQQSMLLVVKENGLDMKRFNQLHGAYINPNIQIEATPEEWKKHAAIVKEIKQRQKALQKRMDSIIRHSTFTIKKYKKIVTTLQKDPSLRSRYIDLMTKEKK